MALECQEIVNSSPRESVDNPFDEKAASSHPSSRISHALSASLTKKKTYNKCIELKPTLQFPLRKGIASVESTNVEDSGFYGGRSITDLPPALVSEILHCLDPKDLGIVSCVSTILNGLATDHRRWKDFYCKRWGPPLGSTAPSGSWKELFVERELRSKSFMGHYTVDALRGHTEAVRAVFFLQSAKLLFTGGYDFVIRMWDMEEEGLSVSVSRPLGCTIRAIAADTELLVAGGTDAFIQCWRAIEGHPHLFDIRGSTANQNSEFRLWGHEGPVTCLALDSTRIFSGSWDMSIRVWDRAQLKCLKTLKHGDWVWALAPRGSTVASTAGRDAYVWDVDKGNLMAVIHNAHVGNAQAMTRSHTGDLLFTGGKDGSIHMFEIANCCNDDDDDIKPTATWTPHTSQVHSLAFEFPWLVSSSIDGRIALINVRKLLGSGHRTSSKHHSSVVQVPGCVEPPQRMLQGFGGQFSVAVGADRILCGGEDGVVRIWDFSQALDFDKRVQALRAIRLDNRMRRRKVQTEMNGRGGRADQSSSGTKRNQTNGNRNGIWHSKRPSKRGRGGGVGDTPRVFVPQGGRGRGRSHKQKSIIEGSGGED